MRRSTLLRGRSPAVRAALRRGLAGTALATSAALLAGLISAAPASAVEVPPDTNPPYLPISLGEQARLDRCAGGFALHIGGPEMKKVAAKALTGTPAELATATDLAMGMYPLSQARTKDRDSYEGSPVASAERREGWEKSNYPYWKSGTEAGIPQYAPQFDKDVVAFTLGPQRDLYNQLGSDGHAVPSKAALDKATALAAELKGKDENHDFVTKGLLKDAESSNYRSPTASDIGRYLRLGGYMKETPAEGSVEFRLEVEALKASWGTCDSRNPLDFYRVMSPIVVTAHMEWEQEYAAQNTPRNEIVNAEVAAAAEARKATEAMIESLGQAWLADQILTWQKYWGTQPANASGRPEASVFTQATKDLGAARTKAADQAKIAATASATAKTAADKAHTSQNSAWAIADAAKTPRGRGLLFAQQSVQVAKASAAAAEAAAKASLTASNAAKATVADSKTLYALAQTQSHALNTEFRRVAAQEAAAQAKAAAASAAAQAKEAADNATKAKAAQTKAETAQETARKAAETAKAERAKAEKEKATAAAERQKAATERGKAHAAEQRAANERETARHARTAAQSSAGTAWDELQKAEDAEQRATKARDKATEAERNKQATAARAASLESAAAAHSGDEAAAATRKAATEARTAANEAATAATAARQAADDAATAAVNARAAATRANAAAQRASSAADKAWSAYQTSEAAAATAHAAAADAIDASDAASVNATKAEADAKTAQAAALKASTEAAAARTESIKTAAWSAVTAGHAYATSQAAAAARDSAAQAIQPANTAIAMGTPYRETDSAAAFAVLVGQSSKTHAEQQATAATAKANEAEKAAATAKALADKASGDAKLAAQAAATAAADSAAALKSMAAARGSAAEAARAADAAKKADEKTKEHSTQAGTDAFYAKSAAKDAADEALGANNEATETEKSATNARASANAATRDANAANTAATNSEGYATKAETAAANANQAAKDADAAADRAEEEERREQEEDRKKAMQTGNTGVAGVTPGAPLAADDEAILMAECGQTCVDEYRSAQAAVGAGIVDWLIANGADILIEMLGLDNIKACFATRDVEPCLWALFDVASSLIPVKKIGDVIQGIYKVATRVYKFFDAAEAGARSLKRLKSLIEKARKAGGRLPAFCLAPKSKSASASVGFSATAGSARMSSTADDPLKPPCLTKVGFYPNTWKEHWKRKKPMMEKLLGKKYPKWKDDEGAGLLDDWFQMITDGRFEFKGIATMKKDHDAGLVFRYQGHTLVLRMDGTFWTFLKDGGGGMNPADFHWLSGGL
ncbi:hypothetical protein [Streptomyces sp. DSM 40907]|uniref:hypothetical protein n=1 Tax=Streptomyces kutzneri TaxID=3051179 RepID=UPI0028D8D1FE|nr:hypothetical protein [Streptomyces sp. DSM 40907]